MDWKEPTETIRNENGDDEEQNKNVSYPTAAQKKNDNPKEITVIINQKQPHFSCTRLSGENNLKTDYPESSATLVLLTNLS